MNTTTKHPGACESCDQLEICIEQDECWMDHRSLFRMAEFIAKQEEKNDA